MDCEVTGNGALRCGETLGYYGAAIDSTRSWGMPEGSRISEDILGVDVSFWGVEDWV